MGLLASAALFETLFGGARWGGKRLRNASVWVACARSAREAANQSRFAENKSWERMKTTEAEQNPVGRPLRCCVLACPVAPLQFLKQVWGPPGGKTEAKAPEMVPRGPGHNGFGERNALRRFPAEIRPRPPPEGLAAKNLA